MIYREFKGIKYPAITFGGAALSGEGGGYGFGSISEGESESLIKKAFEMGITLFDTAPIYGFGLSEERLGRYLPKDAMVISKSGVDWHDSKRVNMTNDQKVTEKMLHQSLKRLNRDTIDIYMIHWPDPKIDIRIPLEVLKKAQEAGKIKHIGLCNTTPLDLKKASEIIEVHTLQSELNLFNQAPFLSLSDERKKYLTMSWGTFDKGILSGRVTKERKFEKDDARSWAPWWNKKEVSVKIERTNALKNILSDYGLSLPQFCLQYNLHYFDISTSIIGMKSEKDLVEATSNLRPILMRERIEEVMKRWI